MQRLFAFLVALACCSPKSNPSRSPPLSPRDAAEAASAACGVLRAHHCPEAEPTPGGHSCEEWMTSAGQTPAGVDLGCVQKISSCAEVARCGR